MRSKVLILEDITQLHKLDVDAFEFVLGKLKPHKGVELSYAPNISEGVSYIKNDTKFDVAIVNPELVMRRLLKDLRSQGTKVIIISHKINPDLQRGVDYDFQLTAYAAVSLLNRIHLYTNNGQ